MDFLRGVILDPANRMSNALYTLANKRQGESQAARALLEDIEALERDVPDLTEDQ
jgi:hypothetical protein